MSTAQVETGVRIGYEIQGPDDAPVLLVLGGISATRHVASGARDASAGWWEDVAGAGRPIDTTRFRVLGVDFADGGCSRDGRPERLITTRDQAERIVEVLDELEIERVAVAIGASYGGMVALALGEGWPDRVGELVVLSAAHETHPMATGLRAIQRRIVEQGLEAGQPRDAMALARAIAMTTYRTAREFSTRFGAPPELSDRSAEFDVERYLFAAGERFADRMGPARFLALSLSADLHRVAPEDVRVPTTVVAAEGDTLVPPEHLHAMAKRLPSLRGYHVISTLCGHDAFLTEPDQVGALLATILESC